MTSTWTVHRTSNARFPFRVAIEQDGRSLLVVRSKSPWPGPGQQIFCLRDSAEPEADLAVLETARVLHVTRLGRKLTVVLDRAVRKRCEFLFVEKAYRNGEGAYEQVFFRTESGIRAHRSRSRLELLPGDVSLTIAVDAGERYAWSFPEAKVVLRRLAVGDYALVDAGHIVAVVERKSFDGLLTDLGAIQALHHQLADLTRCRAAALVVEAQYGDFLDARRLGGRWPAVHVGRVLAELTVMHPTLPMIFAGNRKLANQWVIRFFTACALKGQQQQLDLPTVVSAGGAPVEDEIRSVALGELGPSFALAALRARFDGIPAPRVRRVVAELEAEGLLRRTGRGRATRWEGLKDDS